MGFDLKAVQYEPTEGPLPSESDFHANVWSWRPMVAAIDTALEASGRAILDNEEASGFVFNDGYSVPRSRAIEIADASEEWLGKYPGSAYLTLTTDGEPLLRLEQPDIPDDLGEAMDSGAAWTGSVESFRRLLRFFRTSGGFEIW